MPRRAYRLERLPTLEANNARERLANNARARRGPGALRGILTSFIDSHTLVIGHSLFVGRIARNLSLSERASSRAEVLVWWLRVRSSPYPYAGFNRGIESYTIQSTWLREKFLRAQTVHSARNPHKCGPSPLHVRLKRFLVSVPSMKHRLPRSQDNSKTTLTSPSTDFLSFSSSLCERWSYRQQHFQAYISWWLESRFLSP
jgi:hypothetical protein